MQNSFRRLVRGNTVRSQMLTRQFGGMMGMGETKHSSLNAGPDQIEMWEMDDRVGIMLTLADKPGILNQALQTLADNKINLTSI